MNNTFTVKNKKYTFNLETATITVQNGDKIWTQDSSFVGSVIVKDGENNKTLFFNMAKQINKEIYEDGISYGLKCDYRGFEINGEVVDYAYTTYAGGGPRTPYHRKYWPQGRHTPRQHHCRTRSPRYAH